MKALTDLIALGKENGASDLHLEAGSPSVFRIRGELQTIGEAWTADSLTQLAKQVLGPQWEEFRERRSSDLSKTLAGVRCRINCFQTLKGVSFSIRLLSSFRNSLKDCNLLPELKKIVEADTGLIIVSGPTGSGKSTTLAALIEEINGSKKKNIITLESPIEYYFHNRMSFVRQREIPHHSPSFEQAITDSMREDPDVLVIGEMRSPDVMRLTLNAAETGHLVLTTLHSSTCAEAVSRLCMSFSPEIQGAIRAQIADSLVAVICQRLTYQPQLKILIPTLEIMMASTSVKASIRSGNLSQLSNCIQTGADDGMWSFDRYRRWVEQKKDWVRPQETRPLEDHKDSAPAVNLGLSHTATQATRSRSLVSRKTADDHSSETSSTSDRIEISIEDADLDALAKQIARDGDSE